MNISNSGVFPKQFSNHSGIFINIKWGKNYQPSKKLKVWKYKEGDYAKIKEELAKINWDNLFSNTNDIDNICNQIIDTILKVRDIYIPAITIHNKANNKELYTQELKQLKRKCLRLRNKAMKTNSNKDKENYKKARNHFNSEARKATFNYPSKVANELKSNLEDKKYWWKTVNVLGKYSKC